MEVGETEEKVHRAQLRNSNEFQTCAEAADTERKGINLHDLSERQHV